MLSRFQRLYKTVTQLGFTQVGLFALYKLGLKTGYFKRKTTTHFPNPTLRLLFNFPAKEELLSVLGEDGLKHLITEADEIVDGRFRIFGGELTEIKLDLGLPPYHWTAYETHKADIPYAHLPHPDIKYIWEPARFGWAFTLGRAFHATDERKYVEAFWHYFETFDKANPVNIGPHWMNGQEVAIRLMVLIWAAQAFWDARVSTNQQLGRLTESIAEHAERIPMTLLYARAQNNNHLPSEAAALYTASLALPDHPNAPKWRKLGSKWLNWSFENQIDESGEYIQHSVNYHRLMLQLAIWVNAITETSWMTAKAQNNLANAVRWLADLTDPISGNTPNLGSNDGAYIFPLANGDFRDARPIVQAASQTFLSKKSFGAGVWDEMNLWFQQDNGNTAQLDNVLSNQTTKNYQTINPSNYTWAHLRTADGNLRLAHADQLHLDLWWQGTNIALDPGTYLYNADPPWDNPLAATEYHNTVTVNNQDQMTRASRFMFLDWSCGRVVEKSDSRMVAEHNGYRKLGVTHRRTVSFAENIWCVEDNLQTFQSSNFQTYRLHWLLLDGEWKIESSNEKIEMSLQTQAGILNITLHSSLITHHAFSLARAGELLHGNADVPPTRGWYSSTYGVKIPALSLALEATAADAVQFTTEFNLQP